MLLGDSAILATCQRTLTWARDLIVREHRMDVQLAPGGWPHRTHLVITWLDTWPVLRARVLTQGRVALIFYSLFYWGFRGASTWFPIDFHGVDFWNELLGFWLDVVHSDGALRGLGIPSLNRDQGWVIANRRFDRWKAHPRPFRWFLALAMQTLVLGLFCLNRLCLLLNFYDLGHIELFRIVSLIRILPRHKHLSPLGRVFWNESLALSWPQTWFIESEIHILLSVFLVVVDCKMVV